MATHLEKRLIRVLDHVNTHPAEDLSLDRLADVAALSRFHFHRVFRAVTGETVAAMVRRVRMEHAARKLSYEGATIAETAAAVGYPNVPSFTRAFAEVFRMPPGEYRARGHYQPPLKISDTGERNMTHPVTLREEPARRLVAHAHRGAYPEIGAAFDKLFAILGARGLVGGVGGMAGVFHDDPSAVAAEALRSYAGAFVADDFTIEAPLEDVRLPAGRHAILRYGGPYTGLSAAYDALYCDWLPGSGEVPGDAPVYEVYLNSPAEVAPEALVTEICLPLG